MAIVYNKKGEGFNVPHAIDVKDWIQAGYSLEKPEEEKELSIEELIANLDTLKANDLRIVAKHFEIEYTNKDEVLFLIKEKLKPID